MSEQALRLREEEGDAAHDASAAVRPIFHPTDLSTESERAFDHVRMLADRLRAPVTLFHAVKDPRAERDRLGKWTREGELKRREWTEARDRLDQFAKELAYPADIVVERDPSPEDALLKRVRALRSGLIVMATHGRDGFAHLVHGSMAERVVLEAAVPVLCVREPAHGAALPYRRILLVAELTSDTRRALPVVESIDAAFGAEILVLYVAHVPPASKLSGVIDEIEQRVPSEEKIRAFVSPVLERFRVVPKVVVGDTPEKVAEVARDEHVDLIVTARMRRAGRARPAAAAWQTLLRQAPCPVLVA